MVINPQCQALNPLSLTRAAEQVRLQARLLDLGRISHQQCADDILEALEQALPRQLSPPELQVCVAGGL